MPSRLYPFLSFLCFLVGGCATAPKEVREQLPVAVPSAWSVERQEGALSEDWLNDFDSPILKTLVVKALQHNYDLQAVASRLLISAAEVTIAGADRLPEVSASIDGLRRKQNFIGFPTSGTTGDQEVVSTTVNAWEWGLDLSWEIDVWGRLRDRKSAAIGYFQAMQADLRGAQLSLAAQTVQSWFHAIEARLRLNLLQATRTNFQHQTRVIEERFKRGLNPALDLRLARSQARAAEGAVARGQAVLDERVRALEVLLGEYPSEHMTLVERLPTLYRPVPAGLPSELLTRRPDIKAAERRLAAANLSVREARKALLPSIRLTGMSGIRSDELTDLLDSDFSIWNVAGHLVQPIFQGRRLMAGVKRARAVRQERLAEYAATVLEAFREVETALAAETFLNEQEKRLKEAAEESLAAEKIDWGRYQKGLTTLVTALESQRSAFQAQSDHLASQLSRLNNRVNLYLALGGNFELNR